jgi:K+-transporting ATPase KdpF subunit
MDVDSIVGLALGVALLVYLCTALLLPERF